ncbi:MAG: outer membrane protein assembly factor BamA, partial [Desulfobacula sp.]|nr:outer membrane protein assembly factor BamA [Desulfobacula sp.]
MNISILKKAAIVTIFFCLWVCGDSFAETDIKVAILPFSLDAKHPNEGLKAKIPLMISEKLEQEGTMVIFSETKQDMHQWNFAQFKTYGIELGVDYILTGSVFMAGESISIDSRLINIYERDGSLPLYAGAENLENLLVAISQLSKEITGELYHKKSITDITVTGNKRVETDAILRIIDTQVGDLIKLDNISKDLRKIYEMGYFDDISIKKESLDNGVKLIFEITEKPTVRKLKFNKNSIYEDQELADSVGTKTGSILNINKINSDVNRMRLMYADKNYHNCSITYDILPLEHSQADIVFNIHEGEKIKVEKISFEGNKYFTDKKIKKVMKTSEKSFFSFFTTAGNLNEIEVENDVIRIESLYKNNGFIDTKISDPIIDIGKKSIFIHFKIDEGAQYKIKKIDITGDLIVSGEELLKKINSKETLLYNRETIRKDILTISDVYSDKGFANVNVSPLIKKIDQEKMMDITYLI